MRNMIAAPKLANDVIVLIIVVYRSCHRLTFYRSQREFRKKDSKEQLM